LTSSVTVFAVAGAKLGSETVEPRFGGAWSEHQMKWAVRCNSGCRQFVLDENTRAWTAKKKRATDHNV